jgi:hypothetical protein
MRNESCPQEDAVLKALRANRWSDGLRKHFQECSVCQEAEWSAEWIRNAAVLHELTPLPDPDVLWIRASIAAREREAIRLVWRSAFRKSLLYGSLSAAGTWLALDWMRANLVVVGVVLTVAAVWGLRTYPLKILLRVLP